MNKSAVFISYRRDDCSGYAGRLEDALQQTVGKDRVFRDVHDIAAGEHFSEVIVASLAQASVVLVLIGPRWVGPLTNGQRRIDDPQDFVHREVAAALASNNKVVPVLLAGATLPPAAELPEPLRDLSSRQALTLNDVSWDADLTRLIQSLDMPVARSKRHLLIAALASLTLAAGLIVYFHTPSSPPPDTTAALTASSTAKLVGTWETTTKVNYGWGDRYQERLEFKMFAGKLTGTANYLEYPRGIEDLSVNGRALSFVTHSIESVDNQDRELTHRYSAELDGDTLRLRLQTTGGYTSLKPVEFEALRVANPSQ